MNTIYYPRYFHPDQKLILKRASQGVRNGQFDSMSGILLDCSYDYFDVAIPYGPDDDEGYPFFPGMPFELYSDFYGLGLHLTVHYESSLNVSKFRFCPQGNLEFFFRRRQLRAEMKLWVGFQRGRGNLKTLRRRWKRHAENCVAGFEPTQLPPIQRMLLTLGSDGLSMDLTAPVQPTELCLLYFALEDRGPLVCALAEVISIAKPDAFGMQPTGLRFLNILEEDRRRINLAVRSLHRESRSESLL